MGSATKLKACLACTNGKRRCDKAQPVCGRCNDRDVECRYPPTKRKRLYTSGAETGGESTFSVGPPSLTQIPFPTPNNELIDLNQWAASLGNWDALPTAELPEDSPATSSATISNQKDPVDFFLRPDAWAIRHIPFTTPSFLNSVCMNFIHGVHEFFTEWVTDSHSPFIHNQLYADAGLPPVMQDAFTCIVLHNSKTSANETIIDELLASKASALLKTYCHDGVDTEATLDVREHLARTQALFVHLVLALFSPSIGARANAEQQIHTLLSWTRHLWEAALQDPDIGLPCDGGDSSTAVASANGIVLDSIFDGDPLPRKWRSWVLSESIRRIWLMATSTIGVYLTLRQKWAECHGGIYFTARRDLWEAKSAFTWAAACRNVDPLFICSLECEGLFLSAKASEVDQMLINMLTIMWGVERVENWVARTSGPGDSVKVWKGTDLPMEKGRIAPS
ncbi:uncharacterized protein BKA55DRAFT_577017 [Fusarium redolens]|uniref:Zn(2)-C6 fungal-type domain-containing protein n=1 Tax=Fusarium redolens TaxID=48865 RepID=A0A9P9K4Q5_FUSRE|nr:uncharacterized protein BKA55DRAFT_577017 [Fusarium redolens]KAH7240104.1 hypothetical protein BKA55DRAFT_577017 [Fusarium redolens]